jgi:nucleotide-binding universal stress UspA family protein
VAAKRVEGIKIERAADEILAVKTASLEAHALNQSASAVYELCDGKTSAREMAAEIQRRTGLPADEDIVNLALAELADAGLVVLDCAEPPPAPTRRSLLRRFALSGVAAAMLPVVETIVLPSTNPEGPDSSGTYFQYCPTPTPTPTIL